MDSSPTLIDGSRLCISVRRDGVTAYGNPGALRTLAQWLLWIASSDPKEHFECHVRMDLEDQASKFEGKTPPNVWVSFEEQNDEEQRALKEHSDFDLTFMAVPEDELDTMLVSKAPS